MRKLYCLSIFITCFAASIIAQPKLRTEDAIRIREAKNISRLYADQLFAGYDAAVFATLLVTDSIEFLTYHPSPSKDFTLSAYDTLLQSNVYYRKRILNKNLLATYPAVGGINCIVIGTPENTGKNSTEWVVTMMHEHFHQFQMSHPGYYNSVDSLDLSGGDQTGMWMLNFPFPYDSTVVMNAFAAYTTALMAAISENDDAVFDKKLTEYYTKRKAFTDLLTEKQQRYLYFQLWQEGLARHTEYSLLRLLDSYQPSSLFSYLPDAVPFAGLANKVYARETGNVEKQNLSANKRVSFYSLGLAEGVLADRVYPGWRKTYMTERFTLPRTK